MGACRTIRRHLAEWAVAGAEQLPPEIRSHLASCPGCARALACARLARGLIASAPPTPEPPAAFAARVLTTLPARLPLRAALGDLWRPAWGLVPAFAATAAALLIWFQATTSPSASGLVSLAHLSVGEHLVLQEQQPEPDVVLAAVLQGPGR